MQKLKERKPLFIKILAVVLLVLLCCNLPKLLGEALFWKFCREQDRNLPPHTELLVSACKGPGSIGVPGGEVLFVREGRTGKMYLLDLRTGEKRDVPDASLFLDKGIFLNSELFWLEGSSSPGTSGYRPNYILDLTDGQRYELLDLTWLPRLDGGKFDPKYFSYFQTAEQVFICHADNKLIALSPDFRQHPEGNVIFSQYSLESGASAKNGELLKQLMKDLGVDYEIVDFSLEYADIPSPTGRYTVRNNGIYLSGTNTPVVTRQYTGGRFMGGYFRNWYYDESGVVAQDAGHDLLILPGGGGIFYIPRPILKLHLPAP